MQHHSIEKSHILGHSMGGKTAMLFAVKHPELVNKMVIADISPKQYPPHHHDILAALNSIDFSVQNSRKLVDNKLAELIPEIGVRQFLLKNAYWKKKEVLSFRFNLPSLTQNNKEVGTALPPFTIFKGESLFLAGEKSKYILEKDIPLIQKHFPKAIVQTIKNAGHWLHAENPKDFYHSVFKFLKE
jgi:pimeloyl-ACP methyl ester carboxylesterase